LDTVVGTTPEAGPFLDRSLWKTGLPLVWFVSIDCLIERNIIIIIIINNNIITTTVVVIA